jgi:hypothetical protein
MESWLLEYVLALYLMYRFCNKLCKRPVAVLPHINTKPRLRQMHSFYPERLTWYQSYPLPRPSCRRRQSGRRREPPQHKQNRAITAAFCCCHRASTTQENPDKHKTVAAAAVSQPPPPPSNTTQAVAAAAVSPVVAATATHTTCRCISLLLSPPAYHNPKT